MFLADAGFDARGAASGVRARRRVAVPIATLGDTEDFILRLGNDHPAALACPTIRTSDADCGHGVWFVVKITEEALCPVSLSREPVRHEQSHSFLRSHWSLSCSRQRQRHREVAGT